MRKLERRAGGARAIFAQMIELDEILADVVEQVDGALASAVAGMDGLLVERYPAEREDLAVLAAELTNLLGSARSAIAGQLQAGEFRELILTFDQRTAYVRLLSDSLFCLIVLGADGNLGKARLYGEQAGQRLLRVLE